MVWVSAFTDARFVGLWSTSWIGQFQEYIIYIFVYVNIDYIYIIYVYNKQINIHIDSYIGT